MKSGAGIMYGNSIIMIRKQTFSILLRFKIIITRKLLYYFCYHGSCVENGPDSNKDKIIVFRRVEIIYKKNYTNIHGFLFITAKTRKLLSNFLISIK